MATFGSGKDAALSYAGTVITTYVNNVSFSNDDKLLDVTCLGEQGVTRLSGLEDHKISVEGFFDSTIDALITGKYGGTAETLIYYPQGTAVGKRTMTVPVLIDGYEPPAKPEDAVTFKLSLVSSGTVTFGTVAS
jgi:predicted secreted protein